MQHSLDILGKLASDKHHLWCQDSYNVWLKIGIALEICMEEPSIFKLGILYLYLVWLFMKYIFTLTSQSDIKEHFGSPLKNVKVVKLQFSFDEHLWLQSLKLVMFENDSITPSPTGLQT